jgi:hypothetical protein
MQYQAYHFTLFDGKISAAPRPRREVPGDDFRDVQDFDIVTLEGVGGVAQHDGTIRARHRHRGGPGLHQFGEAPLVYALFTLLASVIGHKKLCAAGSAALRVLAMMRGFG